MKISWAPWIENIVVKIFYFQFFIKMLLPFFSSLSLSIFIEIFLFSNFEMWHIIILSTLSSHVKIQSHFDSCALIISDWMYRLQNTWITASFKYCCPLSVSLSLFFSLSFVVMCVSYSSCITLSTTTTTTATAPSTKTTTARKQQSELMGNMHGDRYRHMEGNEKIREQTNEKKKIMMVECISRIVVVVVAQSQKLSYACFVQKKKYFFFF